MTEWSIATPSRPVTLMGDVLLLTLHIPYFGPETDADGIADDLVAVINEHREPGTERVMVNLLPGCPQWLDTRAQQMLVHAIQIVNIGMGGTETAVDAGSARDVIAEYLGRYTDQPYRAADVLIGKLDSAGHGFPFPEALDGTPHTGDRHSAPCGLCGRVSRDWEDAPSIEGGQTVDPWCQPCLMAWDRGRAVGAAQHVVTPDTGDRYVTPEEMGNPDWYAHPESPNTGGDQ